MSSTNVLRPEPAPPPQALAQCLDALQRRWHHDGHLASLCKDWPRLAGGHLAAHCRPLSLRGGVLFVGAQQPQWRQALIYNRHQLLGSIKAAGHQVREIRVQQAGAFPLPASHTQEERERWQRHPSRVDVHGMQACPCCACPSPAGELARWGHCGFCRRQTLADEQPRCTGPQ